MHVRPNLDGAGHSLGMPLIAIKRVLNMSCCSGYPADSFTINSFPISRMSELKMAIKIQHKEKTHQQRNQLLLLIPAPPRTHE
jgi:hypothetical protein